jgi:hypothetical protein
MRLAPVSPSSDVRPAIGGLPVSPVLIDDASLPAGTGHHPTSGSPQRCLALALGRARHGDRVQMEDCRRAFSAECMSDSPCAYDPEGARMRGAA